jgi:hypothetical protein
MANDLHSFAQAASAQYAAAQGLTPTQYNQQLWQGLANQQVYHAAQQRHMWMWNGIPMSIEDFAQHAYGDTPERTHFLLKFKDVV